MSIQRTTTTGPHADRPVLSAGAPLSEARLAVILIHGRGANAEDILSLARPIGRNDIAYLAPQAAGSVWYPERFIVPRARNAPHLASALGVIDGLVDDLAAAGLPGERVVVAGFSQGACLALDWTAAARRRVAAALGFSGGLIGSDEEIGGRTGDLQGMPIYIGCSDVDFHIPLARVEDSARILTGMGASVTAEIFPDMGHTIVAEEIAAARAILDALPRVHSE